MHLTRHQQVTVVIGKLVSIVGRLISSLLISKENGKEEVNGQKAKDQKLHFVGTTIR